MNTDNGARRLSATNENQALINLQCPTERKINYPRPIQEMKTDVQAKALSLDLQASEHDKTAERKEHADG